jgi:hypothetical protein
MYKYIWCHSYSSQIENNSAKNDLVGLGSEGPREKVILDGGHYTSILWIVDGDRQLLPLSRHRFYEHIYAPK